MFDLINTSKEQNEESSELLKNDESQDHKYIYVLVRNDLSNAQKAVQASHAAIEASRRWLLPSHEHPSVIICAVRSEAKLLSCADKLTDVGIDFVVFREPDIGHKATALASKPISGKDREHFARFQLIHAQTTQRKIK